ncbi:MAG: hypothetical protein ACM3XO_01435 [Bacteroidota bacterium]
MNISSTVERLLPSSCPSIQYRVRREILRDPPSLSRMCELQTQILEDGSVKKVTATQGVDGWLTWNFHGYGSMESAIRLLCEKGVETDQPVLARAFLALMDCTDRMERGLGRAGKVLDNLGFGGAETIRASLFALAGMEEPAFMERQTGQALDRFRFAAQVRSMDEILERHKSHLVFRPGICWPSIYHLRLLAWAKNWRTEEQSKMMAESIQNLVKLSPLPDIHVLYKSQLIAPASFCMHHFTADLEKLPASEWIQWFHRMELLARLGIVKYVPELLQQVQALNGMLAEDHGMFTKKLAHPYFQKWGAYTGLALERDWRSAQRRINDLTFRSLLLLYYSGL